MFDGFFSLPEYVLKKGRLHGHRFGEKKKTRDKEYHLNNQLKKNCTKKLPRNPFGRTMEVGIEFLYMVVFLQFRKSRRRGVKFWKNRGGPFLTVFGKTTSQMICFRDVQHAIIMTTVWVDDDKMKSDYNFKKKIWNYVCVMKSNDITSDTNDDVTTKTNTVHMNATLTSEFACGHLVSSCCRHTHSLHFTSGDSSLCLHSSHPCMKWASLFDFELSITSNFLLFLFSFILGSSCCPSTSTKINRSVKKKMRSSHESYSLRRRIQKLTGIIESQRDEINSAHAGDD